MWARGRSWPVCRTELPNRLMGITWVSPSHHMSWWHYRHCQALCLFLLPSCVVVVVSEHVLLLGFTPGAPVFLAQAEDDHPWLGLMVNDDGCCPKCKDNDVKNFNKETNLFVNKNNTK